MTEQPPDELLSVDTVGAYLKERGLVERHTPVQARSLGGGVSNVVLAVQAGDRVLVVKQSLPRLRVADEWLAKRERVLTEAEALRLAGRLTPGAVPDVLDADARTCTITISQAPQSWRNWKELLLAGEVDPAVGRRLGEVLAGWHHATHDSHEIAQHFPDVEAFEQLRVDPYYREVMRRRPDLAPAILTYVDRMLATHRCLVHGDYSPKNVLLGDDGLWVVDFEVAHTGDPAFDSAFLLNHLMLKAIHRPACQDDYERTAHAFWDTYQTGVPTDLCPPTAYMLGHLGCLMVARVDGKSPAEYLRPAEQRIARTLGIKLLSQAPATLAGAWHILRETAAYA